MAISYVAGFNPKWYLPDLAGKPLAGGKMYTKDGTNLNDDKPVYMDPAGIFPWPNPITFEGNGLQGPFYFIVDNVNPSSYFLIVTDADGNEQFTIENYVPNGGGGGGPITEFSNLNNLIINGQMLFNSGSELASPTPTGSVVAMGPSNALITPDITFFKSNPAANDRITFPPFNLGVTPLLTEATPPQYASYACTNSVAESFKYFQFPISHNVKNLEKQTVTISFIARSPLSNTFSVFINQNFGFNGSPTNTVLIQTFNLTPVFTKYEVTFVVPDTSGKVIGACGDSYVSVRLGFQLGAINQTHFYNVQLVPGMVSSPYLYQTEQQVWGALGSPRTGETKISTRNRELGWLPMNDGTIGSAASAATTRRNIDTFFLFYYLWNTVSNTYAPVSGGRGASAQADFVANKTISLTQQAGRALAGIGAGFVNAQAAGNAFHTMTAPELPPHTHSYERAAGLVTVANDSGFRTFQTPTVADQTGNGPGTSAPFSILSPTTYRNIYIKL